MLFALVGLVALVLWARLRYEGKTPVKLPADHCDASLWDHVYEKERLRILEACTSVEGRVLSLHRSFDGDLHIGIRPEHKSVLNLINLVHAHGELVVEIICEHTPTDANDQIACEGFRPQIPIPSVGDRVRVTGAYVTDRDNGWNEIHPVTQVEILH